MTGAGKILEGDLDKGRLGYDKGIFVHEEVGAALGDSKPVVALESTVISHGLPRPHNLETARGMEAAIRAGGAVPATIAVLGGKLVVGASAGELAFLAESKDVAKVSRADLVLVVVLGGGRRATTAATTAWIAARAGIRVFATGGIGGVHRGVEETLDISADLEMGVGADAGGGGVCWGEGDSGFAADAGDAGDARSAGGGVWDE